MSIPTNTVDMLSIRRSRLHATPLMLIACLSWLTACSVGPDYETPRLNLPRQFSRAPEAVADRTNLSRWWTSLNDQLLDQLIEEAVAGNLDVAAAKARIREARADRREAIGGFFPSVDGSASAIRSKTASASGGAGPVSSLYRAGFDASWEIDLFGARARTAEAATRGVEAADADLRSTLLTLVGDVASNYVALRGGQARIALARRTAASQRETAALTRSKFDAGSSSALDAANAKALAAGTEAGILALEISGAESAHRLGILLGREPGALLSRLERPAAIPAPRLSIRPGVPADLLSRRPDIAMAERQLAQATAKIGAAEAALYPSVSLTGSLSTSAAKIGDLGKGSTIGWSWGPTLTVPIFAGGELVAAVDVAHAQRDEYHLAFRSVVLTAMEDVENALVALSREQIRVRLLDESATSYRRAAELSRFLWRTGSSSFLDVLDAERSLHSTEDTLIQSRVAIATDVIALAKALGGGWDDPVIVDRPEVVDTGTSPHFPVTP